MWRQISIMVTGAIRRQLVSQLLFLASTANGYGAVTLELNGNGTDAHLMMVRAPKENELMVSLAKLPSETMISRKNLEDMWRKAHSTGGFFMYVKSKTVDLFRRFHALERKRECGLHIPWARARVLVSPSASECLILLVISRFNVTYAATDNAYGFIGTYRMSNTSERIYSTRTSNVLSVTSIPYRFIIVLDSAFIANANINSLITAMDGPTWIFTFISIVALTISYRIFHTELNPDWGEMFSCLLTLFGSLLGQGFTGRLIRAQFVLVFSLWLLATVVISNGYSGIMVALMSRQVVPPVPNTLENLAGSEMTIFSSTTTWSVGQSGVIKVTSEFNQLAENPLCAVCEKLRKSVMYTSGEDSGTATSHHILPLVRAILSNTHINTSRGEMGVPPNFALLNSGNEMQEWKDVFKIALQGRKKVILDSPANPLVKVAFLEIPANWMYRLLIRPTRAIVESGLYGAWEQNEKYEDMFFWRRYPGWKHLTGAKLSMPHMAATVLNLPTPADPPQKMSIEVVRIPLGVYGSSVAICMTRFLSEVSFRHRGRLRRFVVGFP